MEQKRSETIRLDYPAQLADKLLTEVTIRRPVMKDLRLNPVKSGEDLVGEMKLIGALCGLRLEEIEQLDSADYGRLTDIFVRFRTASK
ncbi:MAG: phage tail assembly protein [Desulfovibrio sp.]|jgi:hypothetical protein|nr:phage tail assembly protein [Desulfovibrio sp.]